MPRVLNYHHDRLPAGAVYIGRRRRHIPASNRSCPNRVARRSIVAFSFLRNSAGAAKTMSVAPFLAGCRQSR
jgi:hypothetical protein